MRILHTVESYTPTCNGMQEVVSQISERLAKKGHEVTIATSCHPERKKSCINGVAIEEFAISGNMVDGYGGSEKERSRYSRFLKDGGFDVIVNFAAQQWATDLALPMLDEIVARKVLVPTGFSGLYLRRFRYYFKGMPKWMRQYDMNVLHSHSYRDARFAEEYGVRNTTVITNGAAEEDFDEIDSCSLRRDLGLEPDDMLVLLVGSHTGKKGHEEAIRIFDAADISNAFLLIIGKQGDETSVPTGRRKLREWGRVWYKRFFNECPVFCSKAARLFNDSVAWKRANKRLRFMDVSRERTLQAYKEAEIFLFPSRVECSPVVLFEAVASRTPFLATDAGNAVEIAEWTGGGKILPTTIDRDGYSHADIMGSARMLESLWRDKRSRESMATSGYASWRSHFTWGKVVSQYEHLYYSLIAKERLSE